MANTHMIYLFRIRVYRVTIIEATMGDCCESYYSTHQHFHTEEDLLSAREFEKKTC
jgi:hypothetical protein